ncbi:hypothetical protein AXX12_02835 [Anaerosporomusa subterranea]|uniref:Uncharacterized protein n=1 Tax=Anaerosporomusa subterranea TaxID=1794912 RepID=A0A154BT60_ANASB|nr:hypothetical protein [Anaerosporomusa subterranea]KYZ77087.1 hypothetical protein AXX12_02835 [Anaerosporomusa subterranea]
MFTKHHLSHPGMTGLGAAMIGFCIAPMSWPERIMAGVGGIMLIDPGTFTDVIGIVLLAVVMFIQLKKKKDINKQPLSA